MSGYFNETPDSLRLPFAYTEFDPSQADRGSAGQAFTVLLVGQMLPTGTAEALTLLRPTSAGQAELWFGQGSQLAQMVAAYLKANTFTRMMALGVLDAGAGVPAAGAIEISGQVNVAVPLCLYIGGVLVRVATSLGQTGAEVMMALAAKINSLPLLPLTALEQVEALALNAKQAGESGNDIDLRLSYQDEDLPGGLQIAITPLSGGAGNPDAAEVVAALGSERFQVIAWPWTDSASLDALKTELDLRWGPTRQNDGQAVVVKTGAFAEVTTFAAARNDRHLTVLPGEGSPTLPWVDCAASCAILAYYAADDPARPFQTLAIPGLLAPARKDRWSDFPEKEQALYEGVSARGVNEAGQVVFLNVITTCRTNEWGAETEAYLSLNTLFTLSYLRQDWNNRLRLKYPRYKLADDEAAKYFTEGQPVMTPKLGRAEAIACYRDWVGRGLVESVSDFERSLVVERDQNNPNRLNWVMSPDLINQFRIGATVIRFLL